MRLWVSRGPTSQQGIVTVSVRRLTGVLRPQRTITTIDLQQRPHNCEGSKGIGIEASNLLNCTHCFTGQASHRVRLSAHNIIFAHIRFDVCRFEVNQHRALQSSSCSSTRYHKSLANVGREYE
jgi:hypothetical protein